MAFGGDEEIVNRFPDERRRGSLSDPRRAPPSEMKVGCVLLLDRKKLGKSEQEEDTRGCGPTPQLPRTWLQWHMVATGHIPMSPRPPTQPSRPLIRDFGEGLFRVGVWGGRVRLPFPGLPQQLRGWLK